MDGYVKYILFFFFSRCYRFGNVCTRKKMVKSIGDDSNFVCKLKTFDLNVPCYVAVNGCKSSIVHENESMNRKCTCIWAILQESRNDFLCKNVKYIVSWIPIDIIQINGFNQQSIFSSFCFTCCKIQPSKLRYSVG